MKKLVLLFTVLAGLAHSLFAGDDNAAIVAATKSYVAANSGMTKITVTVEQVADDFARAKVTPENSNAADSAWVFLKKKDGKWVGLTLGTSFNDRRLSAARNP
ncbi:MAG: hypothetical protein QOG27_333 [Verrucomicrobiota bacterium]